jgi:response regulator of citrate/malate metabolism
LIRCIIIEDEPLAQDVIKNHLQQSGRFNLVGTYRNALEAKEAIAKEEIDLIFLDIQLPGMTGLNFLRSLINRPLLFLLLPITNMLWRVMGLIDYFAETYFL